MGQPYFRQFSLALWLALVAATPVEAQQVSGGQKCARQEISVVNATAEDRADLCSGADAAIAFFEAFDLRLTDPVVLEVTSHFPEGISADAAAGYLAAEHRILVSTYSDFLKVGTWFNVPIDRGIYRSLIAHETAHAIAKGLFRVSRPSIQAHEYLAYVVMFSSMTANARDRALSSIPGEATPKLESLSQILYFFNPMQFGAQAYRHYVATEDKGPFLRAVLDGKLLAK